MAVPTTSIQCITDFPKEILLFLHRLAVLPYQPQLSYSHARMRGGSRPVYCLHVSRFSQLPIIMFSVMRARM